jgi:hypothetical protein
MVNRGKRELVAGGLEVEVRTPCLAKSLSASPC